MAAFTAAIEAGATWIETDVDLLADSAAVLIHDTALDRTTDRTGSIYELSAADLGGIDAGSWYSPQRAAELFSWGATGVFTGVADQLLAACR